MRLDMKPRMRGKNSPHRKRSNADLSALGGRRGELALCTLRIQHGLGRMQAEECAGR